MPNLFFLNKQSTNLETIINLPYPRGRSSGSVLITPLFLFRLVRLGLLAWLPLRLRSILPLFCWLPLASSPGVRVPDRVPRFVAEVDAIWAIGVALRAFWLGGCLGVLSAAAVLETCSHCCWLLASMLGGGRDSPGLPLALGELGKSGQGGSGVVGIIPLLGLRKK